MPERRRPRAVFLMPTPPGEAEWRPPLDLYRTRDGWLLKFDVAGVRPEDVRIRVSEGAVAVRGLRRDLLLEEGCFHYAMEITYSQFERTVQLPGVVAESYRAEFRDGYLLVRLFTANASEEEKK